MRRYGFDANYFTFEAGRRCETGAGIFSFKCQQQADILFNTLQTHITGRAYNHDEALSHLNDFAVPNANNRNIAQLNSLNMSGQTLHQGVQGSSYVVNARPNSSLSPAGTNSLQSRSTDTLTADYLEPTPNPNRPILSHAARLSTNMRMSSLGSGPLSPSSPGSPNSYTNILEITNLNPAAHQQQHLAQGNIYQEYPSTSIHLQKPTKFSLDVAPTEPAPIASQLQTSKSDPSTNVYMNAEIIGNPRKDEMKVVKLATLAKMESLEIDPEVSSSPDSTKASSTATAVYMNVGIGEEVTTPTCFDVPKENIQPPIVTTPPVVTNNLNSKINDIKKDYTKNLANGNFFGFTRAMSLSQDPTRCYENLEIAAELKPLMLRNRYSRPEIFSKVDLPLIDRTDKSEPCTPTQRKVNYIVLDLDQPPTTALNSNQNNTINNNLSSSSIGNGNNNGSNDNCDSESQMVTSISMHNGLLPPESPKKAGYATIDFNKTVALSNSTNPILDFDQSCRKTRHDSNVTPVLLAMKHSSSMSD